jgi:membrane-associated phospholipid phosphatase
MWQFFKKLPSSIINAYRGWNLVWQIILVVLTYIIVVSDFDWRYFLAINHSPYRSYLFAAGGVGMLVPVLLPLVLLAWGNVKKNPRLSTVAWAITEAELLGLALSTFYKVFTGRIPPPRGVQTLIDTSHGFRFGFLEGGAFWGWPSSHTTVAFAMAFAVIALYPKRKDIALLVLVYAFYIGVGVSAGIHWFSEFVAGAILGMVIGRVVGKSFIEIK